MEHHPEREASAHHGHGQHDHGDHGHGQHAHGAPGHGQHDHGHGHHGHHHHSSTTRALTWALVLNGGFLLIEAGVGWWTGALVLLSDAAHMLSDVGALALALGAARLARLGATTGRTFGLRRAEVLGGFVNGLTLVVAVGWIVWEAVERLTLGAPVVPALPILAVGVVGLAINLGSAWALYRSDRTNLNIRGALVHMLADALGSVGAIAAALLVMAGLPAADAVISLLTAGLVLWGTWGLLRDSGSVLLQMPPRGFDVGHLRAELEAVPELRSIHDLHVWTLDGHEPIVSVHVVAIEGSDPGALRARLAEQMRDHHRARHTTIQVEAAGDIPCGVQGGGACEDSHAR